jgi:ornithine carbamoyltransferase
VVCRSARWPHEGPALHLRLILLVCLGLQPAGHLVEQARSIARETGASLTFTEDVAEGVKECDFLATDVWVSMGEPSEVWKDLIALLKPYQVNRAVLERYGNPRIKFLHCLPAFHDRETRSGRRSTGSSASTPWR